MRWPLDVAKAAASTLLAKRVFRGKNGADATNSAARSA